MLGMLGEKSLVCVLGMHAGDAPGMPNTFSYVVFRVLGCFEWTVCALPHASPCSHCDCA